MDHYAFSMLTASCGFSPKDSRAKGKDSRAKGVDFVIAKKLYLIRKVALTSHNAKARYQNAV